MAAMVLFDGVCNFCDSSVNFIIDHDPQGYFKFAPLQSDEGQKLASKFGFASAVGPGEHAGNGDLIPIDSVILVENEQVFTRSTAALRIVRKLTQPWRLLFAFIVVPAFIRDYFYDLFARYRYKFFGRKDQCMIPTPEVRSRFLS